MEPPFDLQKAHRYFAVEANNQAWDLLEKSDRTPSETEQMIHLAHAASWHWLQVGTVLNQLRAAQLLASVYTEIEQVERLVHYAEQCTKFAQECEYEQSTFDRAFTLGIQSRAEAAQGNATRSRELKSAAMEAGNKLESEDRTVFLQLLESGNWFGV